MDTYEESNFDPSEFYSSAQSRFDDNLPLRNGIPFTIIGNDKLFQALYTYHQNSGITCIILKNICYILTVLFSILSSTFLSTCVNWKAIQDGSHPKVYPGCIPPEGRNGLVMFFFWIFMIWWTYQVYRSWKFCGRMMQIRHIWIDNLSLPEDVRWIHWEQVVEAYRNNIQNSVDIEYIANRIMRYDNFLIGMLTKDVFAIENTVFAIAFSKLLEWNIKLCIKRVLFRHDDTVHPDVQRRISSARLESSLIKAFIIVGILNALFIPFMLCAIIVYFIYRYVGEYNRNPKALGYYTFTRLAHWKLRDFNELPHTYINRLNRAHPKVVEYLDQFGNEKVRILGKFLSYVSTSTFFILAVISYFNSDVVISLFMMEKPIIFYVGIFGALSMMFPDTVGSDIIVYEPDRKFDELVDILHHSVPPTWKDMDTKERYDEISKLFRYKWIVFLEEALSVITVPYVLLFKFPKRAKHIVAFFRENAHYVPNNNLGIICVCADFTQRSLQGAMYQNTESEILSRKMSTSFAHFQSSHPGWVPRSHIPSTIPQSQTVIHHPLAAQDLLSDRQGYTVENGLTESCSSRLWNPQWEGQQTEEVYSDPQDRFIESDEVLDEVVTHDEEAAFIPEQK